MGRHETRSKMRRFAAYSSNEQLASALLELTDALMVDRRMACGLGDAGFDVLMEGIAARLRHQDFHP